MINLNIKDIQHFKSVVTTLESSNNMELNLYCSQSFYDKLLTQCQFNKGEINTLTPGIEVYVKSQIPENCAVLQGTENTYLLKYA